MILAPVWSFGDAGVEHGEVDHGERGDEEVGQHRRNLPTISETFLQL